MTAKRGRLHPSEPRVYFPVVALPAQARLARHLAFVVAIALAMGASLPSLVRAQDAQEECAGDCDDDEAEPAMSAAELNDALAKYERRAMIFGVTGITLMVGGIATLVAATATWDGLVCDTSTPECVDEARLINSISVGSMFLGVLSLVVSGLSISGADRVRDEIRENESARLNVEVSAGPNGGRVMLTGAF